MARDMDLIWVKREAKYFFRWDWTGQISLIGFKKLGFWKTPIRSPDKADATAR
jgi:hypothetical protein